ncbi:MAG: YicC/YloC family endoribonuclease [Cellvibrionaceae bacterium]
MPKSMTGFARQVEQADWGEVSCEIRSVNHRYLEPMIRLPEALRSLEPVVRDLLRQKLQRGKVEVNFQLTMNDAAQQTMVLNTELLDKLKGAIGQISMQFPDVAPVDPVRLLQWPAVIEQAATDMELVTRVANDLLKKTLLALIDHRQREGLVLQNHIEERLAQIADLVVVVRERMPLILAAQKDKLHQRLEEFKENLDENRIEQEMVLLANKADVAEELDRLETHLVEVRHILKQSGAIGRRLDFMMQELNREANTLSSKSLAADTTQAAVSIKVLIEQMREQIQNIE